MYPKLGFERSVFLPEYENTDQIRRYVSDQANYTQVLRVLEEGTGPQFLFNVTIQNHGSYEEEDFVNLNALLDSRTNCSQARQYLTLVKESGKALKEFLQQLEQRPARPMWCSSAITSLGWTRRFTASMKAGRTPRSICATRCPTSSGATRARRKRSCPPAA